MDVSRCVDVCICVTQRYADASRPKIDFKMKNVLNIIEDRIFHAFHAVVLPSVADKLLLHWQLGRSNWRDITQFSLGVSLFQKLATSIIECFSRYPIKPQSTCYNMLIYIYIWFIPIIVGKSHIEKVQGQQASRPGHSTPDVQGVQVVVFKTHVGDLQDSSTVDGPAVYPVITRWVHGAWLVGKHPTIYFGWVEIPSKNWWCKISQPSTVSNHNS